MDSNQWNISQIRRFITLGSRVSAVSVTLLLFKVMPEVNMTEGMPCSTKIF